MKIMFLFLALMLTGGIEFLDAACSPKIKVYRVKNNKKSSKKNKGNRRQQVAVLLKREFKEIFYLHKRMIKREQYNAAYSKKIIKSLNRIAPHLKQLGPLPCLKVLPDVKKTVEEARKALPEAANAGNSAVIDILHQHYIDTIEAYKKDKL